MTPFDLWNATGCRRAEAELFAPHIGNAIDKYGIKNRAAFVAQAAHESQFFRRLEENLNYTTLDRLRAVWPSRFPAKAANGQPLGPAELAAQRALLRNPRGLAMFVYGLRRDLGNVTEEDGWNYRGRGIFMLTGRSNYARYMRASGLNVIANPDLLLGPHAASDSAGWFWADRRLDEYRDNRRITRIVNGRYHGLEERIALTQRAERALA